MSWIERLRDDLLRNPAREVNDAERDRAAVALVLSNQPESILLIRRAEVVGDPWSGQMAFPGGRWSPGDPSLMTTATREAAEEVGLQLDPTHWLGTLDDMAPLTPTLPPISVRPFVFSIPHPAPLTPNPEVASILWVSLSTLLDPVIYRPFTYRGGAARITRPGYHLDEGVVWGMSERILTPFLIRVAAAKG